VTGFRWYGESFYLLIPLPHIQVAKAGMTVPMDPTNGERIDSWKNISAYLGRDVSTVIRWEKAKGLPVHRIPGGLRHKVFAFRQEIDEWLKTGYLDHNDLVEIPELTVKSVTPIQQAPKISTFGSSWSRFWPGVNHRKVIWVTAGFVLLTIVGYAVHSLAFPPRVEFTALVQVTHDGVLKDGLVTDGKTVYFGEHKDSHIVLTSVSAKGGPIRTISTPFVQVVPADISPDGRKLLVFAWEGIEVDRALWIVPLGGGQPSRVGEIRCHAAAWSPDGRRIAFAAQNAIYITADNGASIQKIQSFDASPKYLLWSADGRRLRFNLEDPKNVTFSLWELIFDGQDKSQVSSLVPLHTTLRDCWVNSITLDEDGRSFVSGGKFGDESIYLLQKHHGPWNPQFDLLETNSAVHTIRNLALDRGSRELYALGDYAGLQNNMNSEHLDLLKFDVHSQEFSPFLPGVTADDVNFSRDGRLIAYIRVPDQTLWISRPDGAAVRQIEVHANHLELPRWSPDGKRLAFMAQTAGKPWRIYMVSANGGVPKEASSGTDNQGAPTWSPDGKWMVYGNVECQELGTCAIHKIELSTGRVYTLPGSEGLGTARWSPNGKYIAALNPIGHEVLVFDLKMEQWRKLVDGVNGNDLSWSEDSRYLYASKPAGNYPDILRISLKDSKTETAVDLRSFAAQSGLIDTWFALAPDGSIIFSRAMNANEIYSLAYAEK